MTKLADGIDPLTDTELPGDTALNNVRLARCFFYVAEIIGKVIANGGEVVYPGEKATFYISDEQLEAIAITPEPVGVNEIARRVNAAIDAKRMIGLTGERINNWLVEQGLLKVETREEKQVKVATPEGKARGISTVLVTTPEGRSYEKNVFDKSLQRLVIDQSNSIGGR
ncbi:MAG: hypothetical protein KGZ57_02830 [Dethiobacter sp.]|nr:hypothetical protein [Dethiobacter sp.]